MIEKWTHNDLANDLAEHIRQSTAANRMVWTDMQLGPSGSPRPDVYTIERSYARFRPIVYECKISASDYRSDITSGKWMKYLEYASAVIFAAPAGLISRNDLPARTGLIQRHESVWRMAKAPTMQAADTLSRDAWLKLLISGIDRANQGIRVRQRNEWATVEKLRIKHGDEVANILRDSILARYRIDDAEKEIERRLAQAADRARRVMIEESVDSRLLKREIAEIAEALGLPPGSSMRQIRLELTRSCQPIEEIVTKMAASAERFAERIRSMVPQPSKPGE